MARYLRTSERMASQAAARAPGRRVLLDRYRLLERIDEGGAGEVWRARDEKLDRDVAVKLLGPSADEAFRARFADDARRAAAVVHPNVVTVFDEGRDGRDAFMVLGLVAYELLAGQPAFDGGSDAELVRKQLLGPPPSLRHRRLGVDGRADTVISRALAVAPERRYASAGAFARAFAEATDSGGDHTSVLAAAPVPRALRRLNLPRLDSAVALPALLAILLATVLFFASFPKGLPAVGQPAASAGAPAHTTPNVVGQRLSSGADALLAAGYKGVRWDVAQSSGGAACTVARQDPAAGTAITANQTATLYYVAGKDCSKKGD